MSSYQDVVASNLAALAYALTEASGDFAPYIGGGNLVATATITYQQSGPLGIGDFAAALGVGAKATYTFAARLDPPVTVECWFKLASATPSSATILFATGDAAANGINLYVDTAGHLHISAGAHFDVTTGVDWPDTNWHLVQLASDNNQLRTIGLDGVVRYQTNPGTANAPSPNVLTLGGHSGAGAATALQVAWPALYLYAMSAANISATFTAATDPTHALGSTVTGGGSAGHDPMLDDILAAVRKTYL